MYLDIVVPGIDSQTMKSCTAVFNLSDMNWSRVDEKNEKPLLLGGKIIR